MNNEYEELPIVTLAAAGDVSLSDKVEERIKRDGTEFPFKKIKQIIKGDNISFANLENVFSNSNDGRSSQAHLLKCRPESFHAISNAGFNIVSLANNHILDYGEIGLKDTIALLKKNKILCCGAGLNLSQSRKPVYIKKKGVTFGFLSYAMKGVQSASINTAGAAWIDIDQINEDILSLKTQVDHIIVSLHSGLEFIDYPHPEFRKLCLEIAALGVSLIIGHHPHVIHGIEKVYDCLIAYSLGNLIFDISQMDYKTDRSGQGFVLRCRFNRNMLIDYEVIPTIINTDLQPEQAVADSKKMIMARLKKISENLLTSCYPDVYFDQASELWPKINIAVNINIIKNQGIIAFLLRLPRIKKIYLLLLVKYLIKRIKNIV